MGRKADLSMLEGETIAIFRAAIKSKWTRDPYERRLAAFLRFHTLSCDNFVDIAKNDIAKAERMVVEFVLKEKERAAKKEISNTTVVNSLKPLKLLLEMNDVSLNWKKIKRLLPARRRYALDRIPTIEELRAALQHADLRGRALTLVLCTSGIREGVIPDLLVGHITMVEHEGKKFGRLMVYAGEEEQQITFISSEAWEAVQQYLAWRTEKGERITAKSPLFRDKFDPAIVQYRTYGGGRAANPRPMTGANVRAYYNRLFHQTGLRSGRAVRHEFSVHGFRKWFKTRCENSGVKPIVTELLLGHSVGISDSYYRPTENELLQEYAKAMPYLTISEAHSLRAENEQISKQNEELKQQKALVEAMSKELQSLLALKKVLTEQGLLRERL